MENKGEKNKGQTPRKIEGQFESTGDGLKEWTTLTEIPCWNSLLQNSKIHLY